MNKRLNILIAFSSLGFIGMTFALIHHMMNEENVPHETSYTDVTIQNVAKDSVKVYLTLQSTDSVIGKFGIKETTGTNSQGYFYAMKDSVYHLNYSGPLEGWKISFEAPPMSCTGAIASGYPNGINVVEGSINIPYESFDIGCIDGINCIAKVSVTDTNWTTGTGVNEEIFYSATNNLKHYSNLNVRGIFPYRCTDCIDINPNNVPPNCFDLPEQLDTIRVCQVNRHAQNGGTIEIMYYGNEEIE